MLFKMIGISILTISLLCSPVYSECDFGTVEQIDDDFIYSRECHHEVGRLYNLNVSQKRLIEIVKEDEKYWKDKAIELKKQTDYPFWVAYGLGVIVTLASVWAAGQVGR